jgi:hypothetical protein
MQVVHLDKQCSHQPIPSQINQERAYRQTSSMVYTDIPKVSTYTRSGKRSISRLGRRRSLSVDAAFDNHLSENDGDAQLKHFCEYIAFGDNIVAISRAVASREATSNVRLEQPGSKAVSSQPYSVPQTSELSWPSDVPSQPEVNQVSYIDIEQSDCETYRTVAVKVLQKTFNDSHDYCSDQLAAAELKIWEELYDHESKLKSLQTSVKDLGTRTNRLVTHDKEVDECLVSFHFWPANS